MRCALLLLLLIAGCAARPPLLTPALQPGAPRSVELAGVPFFAQQEYQCGPAALGSVLRFAGVETDAEALRPRVYLPARQGSLAVEMTAAARSFDRIAYQPPPRLDALLAELQAGRPVVVLQNLGLSGQPVWHFAVVIGYEAAADRVILRSGEQARLQERAFNFIHSWSLAHRWALVVLEPGQLPAADDPAGYLRAVAALEATRPGTDLVAAYAAAVHRWPADPIARLGLANATRRSGDTGRAIDLYVELVQADPTQVVARNNLADALAATGCRALALETIEAALAATAPGHPAAPILEQTRAEILAQQAGQPEPAQCERWAASRRD
jgi:hypothetical protein